MFHFVLRGHDSEQEKGRGREREREREGERERERILSRLHAQCPEPDLGLDLTIVRS